MKWHTPRQRRRFTKTGGSGEETTGSTCGCTQEAGRRSSSNTYYHWTPSLRRPPAIFLYSTPLLRNLARLATRGFKGLDRKLFAWQVGRFVRDDGVRNEVVPALYEDFGPARPAFWRLNSDLLGTAVGG